MLKKSLVSTLSVCFVALSSCKDESATADTSSQLYTITFSGANSDLTLDSLKSVSIYKEQPIDISISFHENDVLKVEEFFSTVKAPLKIFVSDEEIFHSKFPDNRVSYSYSFKADEISDNQLLTLNRIAEDYFSAKKPSKEEPRYHTLQETMEQIFSSEPHR